MNALEMLLQRIRSPGAPDPAWQEHLAELEAAVLPPQDQVIRAPQPQGFAVGDEAIYSPNRTIPAGDEVMPAEQDWWRWRQGPDMPAMPRAKPGANPGGFTRISAAGQRDPGDEWLLQNAPFPTRRRHSAPPVQWTDNVPTLDPADAANYGPGSPFGRQPPSPELLAQMQAWWNETQRPQAMQGAPQDPFSSPLNQMMRRLPYGQY